MADLSYTEENYIKTIYALSAHEEDAVSTNALAEALDTKAASVSDMLKKLSRKDLTHYVKYKGVKLSSFGKKEALKILRKHRLWETFLVEKLKFNWDEVHEVAEQLEHIKSGYLVEQLDAFLGYPEIDPHGDPIPDKDGEIKVRKKQLLSEMQKGASAKVIGVNDSSAIFLQYLDKIGIGLGSNIKVLDIMDFDQSVEIHINNNQRLLVSKEVTQNLYLSKPEE